MRGATAGAAAFVAAAALLAFAGDVQANHPVEGFSSLSGHGVHDATMPVSTPHPARVESALEFSLAETGPLSLWLSADEATTAGYDVAWSIVRVQPMAVVSEGLLPEDSAAEVPLPAGVAHVLRLVVSLPPPAERPIGQVSVGLHVRAGTGPEVDSVLNVRISGEADFDCLADSWELLRFGNLEYSCEDDPDQDGCPNFAEERRSLHPLRADSDGDGARDTCPSPGCPRIEWAQQWSWLEGGLSMPLVVVGPKGKPWDAPRTFDLVVRPHQTGLIVAVDWDTWRLSVHRGTAEPGDHTILVDFRAATGCTDATFTVSVAASDGTPPPDDEEPTGTTDEDETSGDDDEGQDGDDTEDTEPPGDDDAGRVDKRPDCPALLHDRMSLTAQPGETVAVQVRYLRGSALGFHLSGEGLGAFSGATFDAGAGVFTWNATAPGAYRGTIALVVEDPACDEDLAIDVDVAWRGDGEPTCADGREAGDASACKSQPEPGQASGSPPADGAGEPEVAAREDDARPTGNIGNASPKSGPSDASPKQGHGDAAPPAVPTASAASRTSGAGLDATEARQATGASATGGGFIEQTCSVCSARMVVVVLGAAAAVGAVALTRSSAGRRGR